MIEMCASRRMTFGKNREVGRERFNQQVILHVTNSLLPPAQHKSQHKGNSKYKSVVEQGGIRDVQLALLGINDKDDESD